jgi:hypothetical protein
MFINNNGEKMDKEALLKIYRENVNSFSDEELSELIEYFNDFYGQKYISSPEQAFDILLDEGLAKAIGKLPDDKKQEIKRKFLSL